MRPGRPSGGVPLVVGLFLLGLVGPLLGACTFEERGNGDSDPDPGAAVDSLFRDVADPGAAVLGVVRTFRDATASGDLALALALTDRDASFADGLAGRLDAGHTRGELLLELRSRLANGLRLREESAEVIFSEGAAVVVSRLVLEERGNGSDDLPAAPGRRVDETAVLVPVQDGWRIRHLHRSIAPES